MPKATTTEDKEGENKHRKDDSCFPAIAINNFYTRTWYPFYVVDTTVEHFATKHTAHHPTTVTLCTGQTVPDPTTIAFTVLATHQTVTTVTEATAPELTVTNPTSKNPTVLLPTVSKSTLPDPTMPNPTVTEATVLKHTEIPTTVPQSTVGATPKTLMTKLTMIHLYLTEAYLNRFTTMTLNKFFLHYSHPPYPEKVKQHFNHNIV